MNNNSDKKEKEKEKDPDEQKLRRNKRSTLTCRLCKGRHRLMECKEFKKKSAKDRTDFATKEKICKNCFSKTHLLKECIRQMKCRVHSCGRKYHTMLQLENQHQVSVNPTKNQNSTNPDSVRTVLQVTPVKVTHGAYTTVLNSLLDSGSDTAMVTSDLVKALNLKDKQWTLDKANAILSSVSVILRLAQSTISSSHHPEKIKVKNAWVVGALNLPSQSVSKAEIEQGWSHLRDVPIDIRDKNISILIAHLPQRYQWQPKWANCNVNKTRLGTIKGKRK